MHICKNIRCNKVIDMEGKGIIVEELCYICLIKTVNSDYSSVHCEYCNKIYLIRKKLLGDKIDEIGICPKCKKELIQREKESY